MCKLKIETTDGAILFRVKIVPGSSKTALAGLLNNMLKIKISVPPEKGKANKALTNFLAKQLSVKKKSVTIISGFTNPVKQIKIAGITEQNLFKKLCLE